MMADGRNIYHPIPQLDLEHILLEAQHRWLRPAEICKILSNYEKFDLTPSPPNRPPAGSLFLFDRKVLRYFRKDGHRWRKKKDGKTVKEAHEKLKASSVDVLHCYYAHGEDNENFQRRSYWMLDGRLEHIVLVHYREVNQGYKTGVSGLLAEPGSLAESPQINSAPSFVQGTSHIPNVQIPHASSANMIDWNGHTLSSEFEDVNSGVLPVLEKNPHVSWFNGEKTNCLNNNSLNGHEQKLFIGKPGGADTIAARVIEAKLEADYTIPYNTTFQDRSTTKEAHQSATVSSSRSNQGQQGLDLDLAQSDSYDYSQKKGVLSSTQIEDNPTDGSPNDSKSGVLKKLDSFGRWMDKEIGGDCDDSLMASDSGNYWNTLDTENEGKEVSSLSRHMQFDINSLAPSLSQEQLFSISEFSPDWAYAGVVTKVLIVGTFLGNKKLSSGTKWGCMFGEIEVSAEVLTNNIIRCHAPSHAPGRVPIYVTCSNRLACSEVREFEYRVKPFGAPFARPLHCDLEEEVRLQTRFAKFLYLDPKRDRFECPNDECHGCKLKKVICSMRSIGEKCWKSIDHTAITTEGFHLYQKDKLIQNLLEERLFEWLVYKVHEDGKGPNILDDEGQGVIHLAGALGYEWAIGPITAAGISPNFRDARGRTGLHWASYFGREETVIAFVRFGAAPGAVDDPTSAFPCGRTAADLASSQGHKGIAGYLAEADLTSHLSSLSVKNQIAAENVSLTSGAPDAVQTADQVLASSNGDQLSLKGSLAAFRNSAHAAAQIQAAFRARSFQFRQSIKGNDDVSEISLDLVALGSLCKVQKLSHYEDYLHSAAIKIQQKYRGWKGRKEFLKIRNRIVKFQARVRGHQVRKQYKKVVWSISILEKAVLRWRRKGAGLRGFRISEEPEKADEYDFLHMGRKQKSAGVEKALERVKSMVRDPEACNQYMRLVAKFDHFKIGDEGTSGQQGDSSRPIRIDLQHSNL